MDPYRTPAPVKKRVYGKPSLWHRLMHAFTTRGRWAPLKGKPDWTKWKVGGYDVVEAVCQTCGYRIRVEFAPKSNKHSRVIRYGIDPVQSDETTR